MAMPVIKLEPIRMSNITSSAPIAQKYISPSLRTDTPAKVDLGVKNFPSLGQTTVVWGKQTDAPKMNDMIKEQIRHAELEEELRQKPKEEDPYKMTRQERLDDGWAILSLKSARDIAKNSTISQPSGGLDEGW